MALQSQPSRIPQPFAGSGTKNTIPSTNTSPTATQAASWASGFPPECSQPLETGGCPVPRNDINGVLNWLSQALAFLQDGGVWAWNSNATYEKGRIVRGSDNKIYYAVAASGAGTTPGAKNPTTDSGSYWSNLPDNISSIVLRTGNQTVSGTKTFLYSPEIQVSNPYLNFIETDVEFGTPLASGVDGRQGLYFRDKNGTTMGELLYHSWNDSGDERHGFQFISMGRTTGRTAQQLRFYEATNTWVFAPNSDNVIQLGSGNQRWAEVYAATSTISTSDERLKQQIAVIPDDVLDAWGEIGWSQFRFNDAVAGKGADNARLHTGLIAQRIDAVFKAHGLNAADYGLFCFDEWGATPEQRDEEGRIVQQARAAGSAYSLRYTEALAMEAAYQRRRADRIEARLAAIEEAIAADLK